MNTKQLVSAKQLIRAWTMAFLTPMLPVSLLRLPRFVKDFHNFNALSRKVTGWDCARPRWRDSFPCLHDRTSKTPFDGHYFYQGAWLSRRIMAADFNGKHVDVGSSIMSIGVLSGFVDTIFVDYRPLKVQLSNLKCISGNILDLSFDDDSVESLSCLHVIEHIGLGRYGDPLDPAGHVKAAAELQRIVKPGGALYITTPVGRERVCFNAHRVFDPLKFASMFPSMGLKSFCFVDDLLQFHADSSPDKALGLDYGCGFFELRKK